MIAAVDVLLDVPPRAEWKPAIVKAKRYLDRKSESSAVEELLEAIDALSAKPESPEPEPAEKPLPPPKRKKAPTVPDHERRAGRHDLRRRGSARLLRTEASLAKADFRKAYPYCGD